MLTRAIQPILIGLAICLGAGCGAPPSADGPDLPDLEDPVVQDTNLIRSELPRDTSPAASDTEVRALTADNLGFAFDLYHQLKDDSEQPNLFFSPHSISTAMAMCYGGARGDTAADVASVMHFDLADALLHPAFNALDLALTSRGQGAQGVDGEGFRLHIANSIWGQSDYLFLSDYLDLLAVSYDAGLRTLDFLNEPEPARETINEWVSDETEGKIEELLAPGTVTPFTRLVLTNAIYFNAAWAEPFPLTASADGTFHRLDASSVAVPMMSQSESFPYATGDGYRAVELPYDGDELGMLIIVPEEGRFSEIESALDASLVDGIVADLAPESLYLTLPKWEATSELSLKDTFEALGMEVAFDANRADFSGITNEEPIWISEVIHEATVTVDEEGTEAAAATAVIMVGGGMPLEMTIDRPFVYLVRDHQTGAVLFVGRVLDPSL